MQGLLFNSLPLIAVLMTAGFAYFSNQQRERAEMSLNRHFEMVENLVDVHTSLLSAEVGQRSYLLTHDTALLQPAMDARALVEQKLTRVRTLMESIPKENRRVEKLARLDAIQGQVNAELDSLATLSTAAAPTQDLTAQILQNQPLLASVGRQLADLRASEQRLLTKRIDEIRSVRQRDYLLHLPLRLRRPREPRRGPVFFPPPRRPPRAPAHRKRPQPARRRHPHPRTHRPRRRHRRTRARTRAGQRIPHRAPGA
ncbi:MAG: CHASE3 domain-containing protein [Chthoniobacter sp.]